MNTVKYRQEHENNRNEGVQQPSTLQKAKVRERTPSGPNERTSDLLQTVPILETKRTLTKGKVVKLPTESVKPSEDSGNMGERSTTETESEGKTIMYEEFELSDEDEKLIVGEYEKVMRQMRAEIKQREWGIKNEERRLEKKMSMKCVGEKKRDWILRNENTEKIRLVQAIMDGLVKAGI